METRMLVDTIGAAAHLGLSPSTLEKLRVSGRGPQYLKLGRAVRYRLDDLARWADERVVRSTSETNFRNEHLR
jgi:predicted DNA-binding transcriptional regulator AlpA